MEGDIEARQHRAGDLQSQFGDRPITWSEIEDLHPEVTREKVMAYFDGTLGDDPARRIVEEVLAWRPWMQAIHSLPKAADEQRIPLVHLALPDDSEPAGFEWYGPRGRSIRLEPRSDGTHAVFLLGVGPSEDAILLADGQPLPLSEPRGDEWARIETDRVMELVKGGNKLELGIRPMIAQASLGRLSLRERWLPRVKMTAIILISVGVGVLIAKMTPMAKPAPLRSSTPDQIASAVQRFLSADENAKPIYQRFDAGSGSSLFALMASVPGERNVFEFIDSNGQARRLQSAMTVPPSVSRWFNQDPEPRLVEATVCDLLPPAENAGQELLVLERHQAREAAVLRVYDSKFHVLREVWNRGYIYHARLDQQRLFVVAASNALPQTLAAMRGWEPAQLANKGPMINPNVLMVVDAGRIPRQGVFFPIAGGGGLDTVSTELFLAQPFEHSIIGLALRDVEPSPKPGVFATLIFTLGSAVGATPLQVLVHDIDASGQRIGPWRERRTDGEQASSVQFAEMLRIDPNQWNGALARVESYRGMLPSEVVQAITTSGGQAVDAQALEVARLRAQSRLWCMEEVRDLLSQSQLPPARYAAALQELGPILAARDPGWSQDTQVELGALHALALYRLGKGQEALEVLRQTASAWPNAPRARFDAMAVECMVRADLHDPSAADVLSRLSAQLNALSDRERWIVLCDARTNRLLAGARAAVGSSRR
ncbi:MAG: hypothetical protein IT432_14925 [Phycisphaerales bacterium]|nr:hypothetical protein [Phycisphaerales bacterium]